MLARKGTTLDEHIHVDHHETRYVVAPSLFLNIRGPMSKFSKRALGVYSEVVFGENPDFFPSDLGYMEDFKCSKRPDVTLSFFSLGRNGQP